VLASGAVVGALDLSTSRQNKKGKRRRLGGRKIRALREKAAAAVLSADKDAVGGAADNAPTLDATCCEPLDAQDPVHSDTLAVAVEGDNGMEALVGAGHMGESVRAMEGAVHLGAELRVGSVVVLSAASAAGQKELPSVHEHASLVPDSSLEKMMRTSTSLASMVGSPSLGPGPAAGSPSLAPVMLATSRLGQAQDDASVADDVGCMGQA
jgi:hypothetical protein